MPGINTGSFFSRLGGQLPGMVNSLAQNYGAPDMANSVRGSSALVGKARPSFGRPKMPSTPKVTNGIPAGKMPGTPIKMQAPGLMPSGGGIDTAPTNMPMPMPMQADMPMRSPGFGGGFWNPSAPKLGMDGQYSTQPFQPNLGGLFGAYNRIRF